jgi:hypothetical protein
VHRFLAAAEAEYLGAIRFHDDLRTGLGKALLDDFERVIARIEERPQSFRRVHPAGIHRARLLRFPYSIYYRVLADGCPEVTAFAHHRRHPDYWTHRLAP